MEITEVNIKLIEEPNARVLAFCSITFDRSFVVRDVKIIAGLNDAFIAMPSRKVTARCPQCQSKNPLKANFCNHCGNRLPYRSEEAHRRGTKLYADIAHPINPQCREMIERSVLDAYEKELHLSHQPGYVSSYHDADLDDDFRPFPEGPHFRQKKTVPADFGAGILNHDE